MGCATAPDAWQIVAIGAEYQMVMAKKKALECGIQLAHRDPLDDSQNSVLLKIGGTTPSAKKKCLLDWMRRNLPDTVMTKQKRKEIGLN
jgi:hypothetical protein